MMINLTEEETWDFIFGDAEGYTFIEGTEQIVDKRRWSVDMEKVFVHDETGKFYKFCWDAPATESQEGQDLNGTLREVEKKTKTVTYYE